MSRLASPPQFQLFQSQERAISRQSKHCNSADSHFNQHCYYYSFHFHHQQNAHTRQYEAIPPVSHLTRISWLEYALSFKVMFHTQKPVHFSNWLFHVSYYHIRVVLQGFWSVPASVGLLWMTMYDADRVFRSVHSPTFSARTSFLISPRLIAQICRF